MMHIGMLYKLIKGSGIHLHQEPYCLALAPIVYDKILDPAKECDAQHQYLLMVYLGASLHLCLIRWDLIIDIVLIQQHVRKPNYEHLHLTNFVMKRAKSNPRRDLKFLTLKPPLRLLDVSNASYATKKTSYAIEELLNLLTTETTLKLRPGSKEISAKDFHDFLSSSSAAQSVVRKRQDSKAH